MSLIRHAFIVLLTSLWLLSAGGVRAAEASIPIVLGEDAGAYREAATAILSLAASSGVDDGVLRAYPLAAAAAAMRDAKLVVAVGTAALNAVLDASSSPVLAMLVPRDAFERIAARYPNRRLSAVFIDQPLTRQLDLLALAQPTRKRLGVVFGPDSQRQQVALLAAATRRGMHLASAVVAGEREVFPAIDRVLADADVLFALPDATVYNAATIPNILLAAYRREVPMLGFSPAYLKAGALLAVYSTPAQMAASAIDMLRTMLAGRPLPPPRHPREFTVAVNRHVARSLGLQIEADSELMRRMRELEVVP